MCSQYLLKITLKNCWRSKWPIFIQDLLKEGKRVQWPSNHEALAVFSTNHAYRASCLSPTLLPQSQNKYHSELPVMQGWRKFSQCSLSSSSQAFLSLCHAIYLSLKFGLLSHVNVKTTVLLTWVHAHIQTLQLAWVVIIHRYYPKPLSPNSWLWLIFNLYTIHNDKRALYLKQSISLYSN